MQTLEANQAMPGIAIWVQPKGCETQTKRSIFCCVIHQDDQKEYAKKMIQNKEGQKTTWVSSDTHSKKDSDRCVG